MKKKKNWLRDMIFFIRVLGNLKKKQEVKKQKLSFLCLKGNSRSELPFNFGRYNYENTINPNRKELAFATSEMRKAFFIEIFKKIL
jgi:hypothetical protein